MEWNSPFPVLLLAFSAASSGAQTVESPAAPVALSSSAWIRLPDSSMNTVFVAGVDDAFARAPNSWRMIQGAWSGGVCVGDEMYVWGGGHGDGAHNGLLAVNVMTGKWRRVTEPSPIWTEELCPGGVCPAKYGDCRIGRCNVGPDGRPVARHTYYLLASDGKSIYSVGGSNWPGGTAGDPPRSFRFDLAAVEWSPLPSDSPVTKSHGSVTYAEGKLYHASAAGFAVLDLETGEWQRRNGVSGIGGMTGVVYVPRLDRLYALGNGKAWYSERAEWGQSAQSLSETPQILKQRHLGMTYYPPEDRILIWNGGPSITTLEPQTGRWGEITPAGDPGPRATAGTFSRFAFCAGRVVLIEGVDRDLFYLAPAGLETDTADVLDAGTPHASEAPGELEHPDPEEEKAVTAPSNAREKVKVRTGNAREKVKERAKAPKNRPPKDAKKASSTSDLKASLAPYYAAPPGDRLVEEQCGPVTSWEVVDVRSNADMEALRRLVPGKRVHARVHWKADPYPVAYVKDAECLKIEGIPGPGGERPLVGGVNGTRAFKTAIRKGGLLIEGLEISPGKITRSHPEVEVYGNCVGVPSDQMFFIVRNSYVGRCAHHAFITSHAHHLYVEVGGSQFEQASSHLAYIDHVAMAYIHDSTFQSPGWGHALRCVALRCVIERVRVSNVQLDGTTLPTGGDNPFEPKRTYIGMHPFEVYTCGENEIRDVDIVFLPDRERNGNFAATLRNREAFRTCDVGEVIDGQWSRLKWGDPDFERAERWNRVTPLRTLVDGMRIRCVGTEPCAGWSVKGAYPTMDDAQKAELQHWLTSQSFASWDDMVSKIPSEKPEWRWVSAVTLPRHRSAFLEGRTTNKVPLPVPVPGWFQRAELTLTNVTMDRGKVLQDPEEPDSYCYGEPPETVGSGNPQAACPDQYDGNSYRQARIVLR